MKTTGNLVRVGVELSACVKHRHDHFGGGTVLLLVHVHGNAAPIVLDGAAAIVVEVDIHAGAIAREGLVHRVVHHLVDHLVETVSIIRVSDVHPGPFPYGLKIPQNGDVICGIAVNDFGFGLNGCF